MSIGRNGEMVLAIFDVDAMFIHCFIQTPNKFGLKSNFYYDNIIIKYNSLNKRNKEEV